MKRYLIIILAIFTIFLTGCNTKNNEFKNEVSEVEENIGENSEDINKNESGKNKEKDENNNEEYENIEEVISGEYSNAELIKNEISSRKELNLNKTTIDDLLTLNNIKLKELDIGNYVFNLGEFKLGDVGYNLILYYNYYSEEPYKSFDVVVTIENDDYREVLIDNYGSIDGITTVVDNKFFIISGFLDDGLIEKIIIIDRNGIAFVANGHNLEHNVENGKIFYSAYDKYAGYVDGAIGEYNYYKVYYEIVEKNGKLTSKELRVDYNDIEMTAQT